MKHADKDAVGRRALMAGFGIAAAGLAASKPAQARRGEFEPARHKIDSWFDELPGNHRIFVDSDSAEGGLNAVGYANNLFIATASAYAGEPADLALVVCFRHFSTPFGYNDAMWDKYGAIFQSVINYPAPGPGGAAAPAPKTNPLNDATGQVGARGGTIDALAPKGVQFAVCSMATQFFSSMLASRTGGKADEIEAELHANGVRNSRFVSAGVMALTRSQEYGYSVLIAG